MEARRRQFLRLAGAVSLGSIAGCAGDSGSGTPTDEQTQPEEPTPAGEATPTANGATPSEALTQEAKLAAEDGNSREFFGTTVALSADGTTALVGATDTDDSGHTAGAIAYAFDGSGDSWTQQATLKPSDGAENDGSGATVALSDDGTTAVVGTPYNNDDSERAVGSAYVFTETDGWSQQAKLTADDGDSEDFFGAAIALSADGTTALVGASEDEDPNGPLGGSAYVFDGSGGSWTQQAKIAAADGDENDTFGSSVALSDDGTTAVIGAASDDDPNGGEERYSGAGSAYVFSDAGGWSQQTKLAADDGESGDGFGSAVSLSGDGTTTIIGAPEDDGTGSAYVFTDADGWSQQAKLTADDGDSGDAFGYAVSLADDGVTALIGARVDKQPNGAAGGSAYVFGDADGWSQQSKLAADDGDSGDAFGESVSLSDGGGTALVGAFGDEDPNGEKAGSAYVFTA